MKKKCDFFVSICQINELVPDVCQAISNGIDHHYLVAVTLTFRPPLSTLLFASFHFSPSAAPSVNIREILYIRQEKCYWPSSFEIQNIWQVGGKVGGRIGVFIFSGGLHGAGNDFFLYFDWKCHDFLVQIW